MQSHLAAFLREEDGAQVVEYALIIAVVSIAAALGLGGISRTFADFLTRVDNCLSSGAC